MTSKSRSEAIVVAFEGIDGSGKTSIANLLFKRFKAQGKSVVLVSTRGAVAGGLVAGQASSYATDRLVALAGLVWPADDGSHHHELGYDHWANVAGAYFHGLNGAILPGLRERHDIVLVENWCFKLAAKLRLKGYSLDALRSILPLDTWLDMVVFVDTPPEQAWRRKGRFSFVELGGQDGYTDLGRESFIHYQQRLAGLLCQFSREWAWQRIDNATGSIEEACDQVEALLMTPAPLERISP